MIKSTILSNCNQKKSIYLRLKHEALYPSCIYFKFYIIIFSLFKIHTGPVILYPGNSLVSVISYKKKISD